MNKNTLRYFFATGGLRVDVSRITNMNTNPG